MPVGDLRTTVDGTRSAEGTIGYRPASGGAIHEAEIPDGTVATRIRSRAGQAAPHPHMVSNDFEQTLDVTIAVPGFATDDGGSVPDVELTFTLEQAAADYRFEGCGFEETGSI